MDNGDERARKRARHAPGAAGNGKQAAAPLSPEAQQRPSKLAQLPGVIWRRIGEGDLPVHATLKGVNQQLRTYVDNTEFCAKRTDGGRLCSASRSTKGGQPLTPEQEEFELSVLSRCDWYCNNPRTCRDAFGRRLVQLLRLATYAAVRASGVWSTQGRVMCTLQSPSPPV